MLTRPTQHPAQQGFLGRISIRLRLAVWYALLLTATLTLFSVIIFAVARFQIESSVDQSLQSRATLIAQTLQDGILSSDSAPQPTPTPSATSSATPAATPVPTPVPTPDPRTTAAIQRQLTLSSVVTDLLGRLNFAFEVLNYNHDRVYLAPNIVKSPLPQDNVAIDDSLRGGSCSAYTRRQNDSLLRLYVYPLTLAAANAPRGRSTVTTNGPTTCTVAKGTTIVGVIVVAQAIDDLDRTLSTLQHLLIFGVLGALLFTSLGGWLIASNGLRPIAGLTRMARTIATSAQGGLGKRVGYRGPRDEIGELAATFDEMLAALEHTLIAQRRFIADASHELRAPLTTIKGTLEFLHRARDLPEDERMAAIEDAYDEAERMATLVNDLLLLARVDAAAASGGRLDDQMRGRRELVELDQLVLDIFRQGRAQLETRPAARIQMAIGTLEPMVAEGDPGQLRQVLLILLDNALKYTPAGGRVRISVSKQERYAAISVTDTGMGIASGDLPHIFERFYRADLARERDEHGSGLGLAIAHWIVQTHNGEIHVTSAPGKGSTVTILLPAIRRPGEQASVKQPAVNQGKRGRAFVVGAITPLARLASNVSRPRPRGDSTQTRPGRRGRGSRRGNASAD